MIKKLLAVTAIVFSTLSPARGLSFELMFREAFNQKADGYNVQGAAVCGNFLFQFFDANRGIVVYGLPEGKVLDEIPLKPVSTYHNNNVNFSDVFSSPGDEFPVLYAGQENIAEHKAVAYRIARKGERFSAEVLQTIILPSPVSMGLYYPNIAVGDGFLYVTGFSSPSWKKTDGENGLVLLKFRLPSLKDGKELVLDAGQILERRNYPFRVATQGAAVRDGKLYQVYGVPKYGATSLVCTDLSSGKIKWTRDLADAGIELEPEALGFWGEEMLVVDVCGNVFKCRLP